MIKTQNPQLSRGMFVNVVVFTKLAAIIMKNNRAFVKTSPGIMRCIGFKPRHTGITAEINVTSAAIAINSISLK